MTPRGKEQIIEYAVRDLRGLEQMEAAKKAEAKAAAFDWLMARMQEAYDHSGWVEVGDISISAQTVWGHREECLMKAEIQWKDRRDEPLDLLAAIEKAMGEQS